MMKVYVGVILLLRHVIGVIIIVLNTVVNRKNNVMNVIIMILNIIIHIDVTNIAKMVPVDISVLLEKISLNMFNR